MLVLTGFILVRISENGSTCQCTFIIIILNRKRAGQWLIKMYSKSHEERLPVENNSFWNEPALAWALKTLEFVSFCLSCSLTFGEVSDNTSCWERGVCWDRPWVNPGKMQSLSIEAIHTLIRTRHKEVVHMLWLANSGFLYMEWDAGKFL